MSNKTKLIKKDNQKPNKQREIINWLFNQSFGMDIITSLGSKIGIQSIQSIEKKPSLALMSKKTKKKILLPKIYFGARIEEKPWLLGIYPIPRTKNIKRTDKTINKYLESFDKISAESGLKSALIMISDRDFTKPESVTTSLGCITWKDFISDINGIVTKNISIIPPFKYEIISKWIEQWNFIQIIHEIENESFENLKVKSKIPYKFGRSSFSIKNNEKGSFVKAHGQLKRFKPSSSSLILELDFIKKNTKKWRRQWDVSIPKLENELIEEFNRLGYSPEVKSMKPIEELNKKTLKKLAKKKTRLRFEFPMSYDSKHWMIGEKNFKAALHEVTSTYIKKVSPLIIWEPHEEEQEEEAIVA